MTDLNHIISAKYAREILDYDPETGIFRWKWREGVSKRINARYAGKAAGNARSDGYLIIGINNRHYYAHRLAWLFVHGEWPPKDLDHIDGDPGNNRIDNLRLATMQENMRNVGLRKTSSTGVTGVSWDNYYRKFMAHIGIDGKFINLGRFPTLSAAAAARRAAEIEHFGAFRWVA